MGDGAVVEGKWLITDDFGRYEICLFAVTQLGYLPVAASLLAANFFEPTPIGCASNDTDGDFHSLLTEYGLICGSSRYFSLFTMTDILSTTVMFGGLLGAMIAGFLADRYGRKPTVVGAMALVGICNILLCIARGRIWLLTGLLMLMMGAAAGGYMVVNLVLMIEAVEHSRSRLLIVSLNGWPFAMCFTAGIAFATRHWMFYHVFVAVTALIAFIILQLISLESARWLTHHNHSSRAEKIIDRIAQLNSGAKKEKLTTSETPLKPCTNAEGCSGENQKEVASSQSPKKYSYADLFRHKSIGISVVSLVYCFTVSSFVSFSGYFHSSVLPGNRYLNLFSMGVLKLMLGMVPFVCGHCLGRKPILLISVGIASVASCLLVVMLSNAQYRHGIVVSCLSILMTSALDPNWKIIHLYSTELFPTGVRNMARGVCQMGARIGSVLAPAMHGVYTVYPVASISICAALLCGQWLLAFFVFPKTDKHKLPENMPEKKQFVSTTKV